MAFSFSGVAAEVEITGSVTTSFNVPDFPVTYQHYKAFGGAGVETVYTPTAGKILYITSIQYMGSNAAYLAFGDNISDHSTDGAKTITYIGGTAAGTIVLPSPMKVATAFKMATSAAVNAYCSFTGYEV